MARLRFEMMPPSLLNNIPPKMLSPFFIGSFPCSRELTFPSFPYLLSSSQSPVLIGILKTTIRVPISKVWRDQDTEKAEEGKGFVMYHFPGGVPNQSERAQSKSRRLGEDGTWNQIRFPLLENRISKVWDPRP